MSGLGRVKGIDHPRAVHTSSWLHLMSLVWSVKVAGTRASIQRNHNELQVTATLQWSVHVFTLPLVCYITASCQCIPRCLCGWWWSNQRHSKAMHGAPSSYTSQIETAIAQPLSTQPVA